MNYRVLSVAFAVAVFCICAQAQNDQPALRHDIIRAVNSNPKVKWEAGVNIRFAGMTLSEARRQCGALPGGPEPVVKMNFVAPNIPESFDARQQWGSICPSVYDIRDQGSCGSCWAFGAAEAMTDRTCIVNNGTSNPTLSAEDLVSCCVLVCGMGCNGGFPLGAWFYWTQNGLVTGGAWNSNQGCYPYQVEACDHHVSGKYQPCGDEVATPTCNTTCQNGADYKSDKHFGATAYAVSSDVSAIQTEIMTHGPVEGSFTVYADFLTYKSGVYHYVSGDELGGHAIKILGWGVDNGENYWIVANSWNSDWGNQGFFNIRRGTDECGIESGIVAGLPK